MLFKTIQFYLLKNQLSNYKKDIKRKKNYPLSFGYFLIGSDKNKKENTGNNQK